MVDLSRFDDIQKPTPIFQNHNNINNLNPEEKNLSVSEDMTMSFFLTERN